MDYYILDDLFRKKSIINDPISVIWTERYRDPGDCELVVPLNFDNYTKYGLGTFLNRAGSKEVVIVDTILIEDQKMKIKGESLYKFLEQRAFRYPQTDVGSESGEPVVGDPANMAKIFVYHMAGPAPNFGPQGSTERITNLTQGIVDTSKPDISVSLPPGTLFDTIQAICKEADMGFRLYLDSVDDAGNYSLKFDAYFGSNKDLLFSEDNNSLSNGSELLSNKNLKNVAFVYAPALYGIATNNTKTVWLGVSSPTNFERRLMIVRADDLTEDNYVDDTTLHTLLEARGRTALAQQKIDHLFDGEAPQNSPYKIGVDYNLGDIVTLQADSGLKSQVRIIEHIWSQDETGEKAYPSLEMLQL